MAVEASDVAPTSDAPMFEPLSEAEMDEVEGGYCFSCRVFCGLAGATAGAATGNPGIAFLVGLTCIELVDPQELN